MLRLVKANLMTVDLNRTVLAHGVNCSGAFNAGVARTIAQTYPIAKKEYLRKFWDEGWKLGEVQFVELPQSKEDTARMLYSRGKQGIIANCATQHGYGRGRRHANYEAIQQCFHRLIQYCSGYNLRLVMPKIGAGLGGGDWSIIEKILLEELKWNDIPTEVYYLED